MKLFLDKDKKVVLINVFSMGVIQGANFILPLITLPYLVRVIGVEFVGLIAFANAIIMYFVMITDYGFNLSATRKISVFREDCDKVNEIYSSVMVVKFLLMLVSFMILIVIVFLFDNMRENMLLYVVTFGIVLGQVLFPVWLFQGMESMKHMAYINIFFKSFFAILIFVFVKDKNDYMLVPLFVSCGYIMSGLASQYIAKKRFGIDFIKPSIMMLKGYLVDGWHVFASRVYLNLYTTTNMVILGVMSNNVVVGYYTIADKIAKALAGLFLPIMNALYPYLTRINEKSKAVFYSKIKKVNYLFFVVSLLMAIGVFVLSEDLVKFFVGGDSKEVNQILMVLAISIITAPFGPSYTNGLLILKNNKAVSSVVKYTFVVNALIIFPMIYYYGALGLAITWVIGQVFHVSLYRYVFEKTKKYKLV